MKQKLINMLTLINFIMAVICTIMAAILHNLTAVLGWLVASLWIFRHIIEKYFK